MWAGHPDGFLQVHSLRGLEVPAHASRELFLINTPERRLELFFSGRNNDRLPARQTTGTFVFSGRNNDSAPARQTTGTFFFWS